MTAPSGGTADDYRGIGAPVAEACAGMRIDHYLGKLFPFRSRHAWSRACRDETLRVNGLPVKPAYRVRIGDVVQRFHPLDEEPIVERTLVELFRADGLLGVAKPGALPMHEAGRYRRQTFAHALREQFGPAWSAVHRLDRETSGVVLCSDDAARRAALADAFAERSVEKEYWAIAGKNPLAAAPFGAGLALADLPQEFTIDADVLCPVDSRQGRYLRTEVARAASTEFHLIAQVGDVALLRCLPHTGRTNQIRVHLARIGWPIIGDARFGGGRRGVDVERHFLHARRLRLSPSGGRAIEIVAPLPADMRDFAVRTGLGEPAG